MLTHHLAAGALPALAGIAFKHGAHAVRVYVSVAKPGLVEPGAGVEQICLGTEPATHVQIGVKADRLGSHFASVLVPARRGAHFNSRAHRRDGETTRAPIRRVL